MKKKIIITFVMIFIGGLVGTKKFFSEKKMEILHEESYFTFQSDKINFETNVNEEKIEKEEKYEEKSLVQEEIIKSKKQKVESPKKEVSTKKQEQPKNSNIENTKKESKTENKTLNEKLETTQENKKLSKSEVEEYLKKNVSDFRYDFDSKHDCQIEGDKWLIYGWFYNCTSISVPNSDIQPVMLVISTGKFFCDGKYTKNERYDWHKPKISSISYLRELGYPCENIEGLN